MRKRSKWDRDKADKGFCPVGGADLTKSGYRLHKSLPKMPVPGWFGHRKRGRRPVIIKPDPLVEGELTRFHERTRWTRWKRILFWPAFLTVLFGVWHLLSWIS